MVNGESSSNTAIVAILVIVILALAILYYLGVLGPKDKSLPTAERSNINIESSQKTEGSSPKRSLIERPASGQRSSRERSLIEQSSNSERS